VLWIPRLVTGAVAIVGAIYLARELPPLLVARRAHRARVANIARYGSWRGGPGRATSPLDAVEGEYLEGRLRRLALLALAVFVGALLALVAEP
jgi:hypothetical protein